MGIRIEDYKPVDKSATCRRCKSTTVTWYHAYGSKWVLCEIFTLAGEEVYSTQDIHMRYCTNPIRPWNAREAILDPGNRKIGRQAELSELANEYIEDEKTDKPSHPFTEPGTGAGHELAMEVPFKLISQCIEEALKYPNHPVELNKLQTLYYRLYNEIPS